MVYNIPYTVSGVRGDIGILYTIAGVRSMIPVENDTSYARYGIRHVIYHCWRERYKICRICYLLRQIRYKTIAGVRGISLAKVDTSHAIYSMTHSPAHIYTHDRYFCRLNSSPLLLLTINWFPDY